MIDLPVLIIAAGASRRLGRPKQTLEITPGVTLLSHTISVVKSVNLQQIWVVVGAYSEDVIHQTSENVNWVENSNWESGMGTSISVGVKEILNEKPNADQILVMLTDQPYLDLGTIENLIEKYETSKKGIVFSVYDNEKSGPPAIFSKRYFASLINLSEDKGARVIIKENISDTSSISFPKGSHDIDTFDDYQNFLRSRDQSH